MADDPTGDPAAETDKPGNGAAAPRVSRLPPPGPLPKPAHRRGKPVLLADDREWIFPPLLLDDVWGRARELVIGILNAGAIFARDRVGLDDLVVLVAGSAKDWVSDLILIALDRNYPDLHLEREDMVPLLDMECTYEAIGVIINANGFRELFAQFGLGSPTLGATSTSIPAN